MGRLDESEIAILAVGGGAEGAQAMVGRVQAALDEATSLDELAGMSVHCESVVHDATKLSSPEALMTFAWVVEG